MTEVSSDVIGSVSGKRMGEGPGKRGGTDLTEVTDDSEDTTEGPATDLGSGMHMGQQPQSLPRRQTAFSGLRRHSASSYSVDASVTGIWDSFVPWTGISWATGHSYCIHCVFEGVPAMRPLDVP